MEYDKPESSLYLRYNSNQPSVRIIQFCMPLLTVYHTLLEVIITESKGLLVLYNSVSNIGIIHV